MPKTFSGKQAIKILCREFGFFIASQKGSHVKLCKISKDKTITTIVPDHKELATGTLRGVLRLAKVEYEDFIDKSKSSKV